MKWRKNLVAGTIALALFVCVESFVSSSSLARRPTFLLSAETSSSDASSDGTSSNDGTLYDILGAKPTDSPSTLRRKYTELARQLHPDSGSENADASRFSELATAWGILGDSKQRLRYDRSLKANEFADNVVDILEVGFRNAVPFLQKTANTTMAAVETSSKMAADVSEQLQLARERLALEQKKRDLEQRAERETARATMLKKEREAILSGDASVRLPELQQSDARLTATQASRILEKLGESSPSTPQPYKGRSKLPDDIRTLEALAQDYSEKSRHRQEMERALQTAARQQEAAIQRELSAQQKLEEARRELEAARKNLSAAKQEDQVASQQGKRAVTEADIASASLEQHQELVRNNLRRKEEEELKKKAKTLYNDSNRSMNLAKSLQEDAAKLSKDINELIQKEKERERK